MNTFNTEIPSKIGISLTTGPILLGIAIAESLTNGLIDLGQSSEEIFRGDRLPLLHFPQNTRESDSLKDSD